MTHGCSPFAATRRNLTALDIVTAHSILPGREDVALLIEEAMRGEGWTGGKMEVKRRLLEDRVKRKGKKRRVREDVGKILGVHPGWWGDEDPDSSPLQSDSDSDLEEEPDCDSIFVSFVLILRLGNVNLCGRPRQQIFQPCSYFPRSLYPRFSHLSSPNLNPRYGTRNPQIHYICWRGSPA